MSDLVLQSGTRKIPVRCADEGIAWASAQCDDMLGANRHLHVVSDERVALHYLDEFVKGVSIHGNSVSVSLIVPGEANKTLATAARVLDDMALRNFPRDGVVIGLGGGVVTDIAGFVAATYHRGIDWIAVPTSLLGMVDAAIGGKTGVDHVLGKNLIGAFHQPVAVIAPAKVLATLDKREWRSGSAEVVKSALLSGGELWELACKFGVDLSSWPDEAVLRAIHLSMVTKVTIVNEDEREGSTRRLLNLGHTFGHAIEAATGYTACTHGEAVILGLRAMLKLSAMTYRLNDIAADTVDLLLSKMPVPVMELDRDALLDALRRDKKIAQDKIHWILLEKIGQAIVTTDVKAAIVEETSEWLVEIAKEGEFSVETKRRFRILVLNGPNLNLLGLREPVIYGTNSLADLERYVCDAARELALDIIVRQSNHEGELVSLIQWARYWADGVVVNPGGYTHSSVAIRDAISAVKIPTVEVHLSDIGTREDFRRISLVAPVCVKSISGQGLAGYRQAVEFLVGR